MQVIKRFRRWPSLLALTALTGLACAAVALADNVQVNDLSAGENAAKNAGDVGTASVRLVGNNANGDISGCNVDANNPATVTLTESTGKITFPAGSTASITDCGNAGAKQVGYKVHSSASGVYTVTATATGGKQGALYNDDTFTITVAAAADSSPPVITPSVAGTLGNNGWYTSNVNVSWAVVDAQSAISSSTGCAPATISTDTAGTTLTCSATSTGGTASDSVTVKRDATAPSVVRDTSVDDCDADGNNGWCKGTQTAGFTASDAMSGLVGQTSPYSFTRATSVEGSAENIASGAVSDNAGNTHAGINAGPFKIDSTNPTIAGSASPSPNAAGWNNTDVNVTFTCGDSGSTIDTCGPTPQTLSSEGRDQSATGNAADKAGNTASDTVSGIDIDKTAPTPPTATLSKNAEDTDGGWYKDSVTVSYGDSSDPDLGNGDAGSGVDATAYSAAQLFNTSSDSHGYSGTAEDNADNQSTPTTGTVKVDATNPTLSVSCPSEVTLGTLATATVNASDAHSGLVPLASGATLLAAGSIGPKTKTITVEDKVGHEVSQTCNYSVVYDWNGFYRPIDNLPTFNSAKAGSAVPVKFSIDGTPVPGSNTSGKGSEASVVATGYPTSGVITCGSTDEVDPVEQTVTAGQSSLTYDAAADQWVYVWKTEKSWTGCRQLVVKLADGTYHRANFKLTK